MAIDIEKTDSEQADASAPGAPRIGTILAVCYSKELINGVAKEPHDSAEIEQWGIPGDRHYGETRITKGQVVPNMRTITVLGVEGTREVCEKLGIPPLPPGGLGENLLLEGLGDLSYVQPGDHVHIYATGTFEPKVILDIQKQNDPCANTQFYHKMMVKELYGRRGLLCTVLKPGHVEVGDRVMIIRPH